MVLSIALLKSYNLEAGLEAVFKSNMAKVDPETGCVRRRADQKILKLKGRKSRQEENAHLTHQEQAAHFTCISNSLY